MMTNSRFFEPFATIDQPERVRHILFVTLSNIGDVILTTPTLEKLHQLFPNAMVDLVCDQRSAILFTHCPYVNRIIMKDKQTGWLGWITLALQLRKQTYDVAVDLRTDGLLYAIKAKIKLYKLSHRKTVGLHSVNKHFHALKPTQAMPTPNTTLWLSEKELMLASKLLAPYAHQRILAIGLGANFHGKIWPVASFAALSNRLKAYFDVVLLFGDKNDLHLAAAFMRQCEIPTINYCDQLNLLETAACLKKAHYFIGNDSGLGHMASALGVPTFTVFGVGQPQRYRPWGKQAMWYQAPNLKITTVDPETLLTMMVPQLIS